jgi:hypothetical protein
VENVVASGELVARPLTARGLRRQSAVMPKDLANADFVREFIALLVRNAPGRQAPPFAERRA